MSNRIYQGVRDRKGLAEVFVIENTRRRPLKDQLVLYEDFYLDWGFPGTDAKNLALTLLADALEGGDDPLVDGMTARMHDEVVCNLPAAGWQMYQWEILDWVYGRSSRIPVHPLPLDGLGGGVEPALN